jgi:aminoglycoside phosphotransferase
VVNPDRHRQATEVSTALPWVRASALWWAWGFLTVAWLALAFVCLTHARNGKLCPPAQSTAVRLAQVKGATEVGVVYLDFAAAQQARDYLDRWLHQYGRCP